MDTVIKNLREERVRQDAGDNMIYAGDIAHWSGNKRELKQIVNCWKDCLNQAGWKVNAENIE